MRVYINAANAIVDYSGRGIFDTSAPGTMHWNHEIIAIFVPKARVSTYRYSLLSIFCTDFKVEWLDMAEFGSRETPSRYQGEDDRC